LSNYLDQNLSVLTYTAQSWVVLSAIEQRIKEKIEKVGKPLKDWDIQINYGIKTGFNEAFIIDGAKRKELIEKSPKSEEIIRPILRGRDIKRYGYEFADLYIIAAFPSKHYNIDDYPAIKEHLLSFGYDRLKQTGEKGARKKTNNQWFETQDSISYWEDFSRQKIVYIEIMTDNESEGFPFPSFSLDNNKSVVINTGYIITSQTENIKYILSVLNSKLGKILVKFYVSQLQSRQFRMLAQFVTQLPIPKVSKEKEDVLDELVSLIFKNKRINISTNNIEAEINKIIYTLYELNEDEIIHIERQ